MNISNLNYMDIRMGNEPIVEWYDSSNRLLWNYMPEIYHYFIPDDEIWYKRIDESETRTFSEANISAIKQLDMTTPVERINSGSNKWIEQNYYDNPPYGSYCRWKYKTPVGGCVGGAFKENCKSLQWIIFSEVFNRCENETFYNCVNLEYVYFGSGFRFLGDNPFIGCDNLKTMVLGIDNVYDLQKLQITQSAFNGVSQDFAIYVNINIIKEALDVRYTKFQGARIKPFYPNMPECMKPA